MNDNNRKLKILYGIKELLYHMVFYQKQFKNIEYYNQILQKIRIINQKIELVRKDEL